MSDEQRMETAIRAVLRSGQSRSHRSGDGNRYTTHQFDSGRVESLLAEIDKLFPGVVAKAKAPSLEEMNAVKKELAWLEQSPDRWNKARRYQLTQWLHEYS